MMQGDKGNIKVNLVMALIRFLSLYFVFIVTQHYTTIEDPNDYNSKIFVDTMEALGLRQHVVEPTHQKGYILGLIFTETASQINVNQLKMLNFILDHRLISATINVKKMYSG